MGSTTQATRLTKQHHRAQRDLRSRFAVAFVELFRRLLDPDRVDDSIPEWLPAAVALVDRYRTDSAEEALDYYRNHRAAELGDDSGTGPQPDRPDRNREALETSVLVTGPVAIKAATARGRSLEQAARIAETRSEAAAARHVASAARHVLNDAVAKDSQAVGWARIARFNACWLCAMQASRGPVFKSRGTAGQSYHDGCNCTVEPIYTRDAPWPDGARDWQKLWQDTTVGLSGHQARKAFRRAIDA